MSYCRNNLNLFIYIVIQANNFIVLSGSIIYAMKRSNITALLLGG